MELLACDRTPGQLQPVLDAEGLDQSIAVQARAGREETGFLLEFARGNRRIAGVVGWEDLASPHLAEPVAAVLSASASRPTPRSTTAGAPVLSGTLSHGSSTRNPAGE